MVLGEGDVPSSVLFLGEGPGEQEDEIGRPAIGRPGKLLRQSIISSGIIQRQARYFITDLVRCRLPNNRDPTPMEAEACWEWTREILMITNPQVIVTLGRIALAYLAKRCGIQQWHAIDYHPIERVSRVPFSVPSQSDWDLFGRKSPRMSY